MNQRCPDSRVLAALLEGSLPPESERDMTLHLSKCGLCQQTLDSLSATADFSAGVANRLRSTTPAPAHLEAVLSAEESRLPTPVADSTMSNDAHNNDARCADVLAALGSSLPCSVGGYELTEFIGRGGMGVVFKATDPELQRTVALKFLAPDLAKHESSRERFLREARAVAAINHPSIVTIHAVNSSGAVPWLVMEFIAGESLEERLARTGKLSWKETVRVGYQLASGLHAAHKQGILHRDIKPANVLVDASSKRVKLTDFGLARAADQPGLTQSGVIVGTPQYLAPEVVAEEAIDHRTDLFSLGSVLYTACSGRPAIEGTTVVGLIQRIAACDIRPIHESTDEVPLWLSQIIQRLHSRKPIDRYQSAAELAKDLKSQSATQQTLIDITPTQPIARPPRSTKSGRIIGGAVLAAVLVAGTLLALVGSGGKENNTSGETNSEKAAAANSGDVASSDGSQSQTEPLAEPRQARENSDQRSAAGPFVVKSTGLSYGSLAQAIRYCGDDIITVTSSEPIVVAEPIDCKDRNLTVEAAENRTPRLVLRYRLIGQPAIESHGSLTLQGLEIDATELTVADEDVEPMLMVDDGSLNILNCRLVAKPHTTAVGVSGHSRATIRDSVISASGGTAIDWNPGSKQQLLMENAALLAETAVSIGIEAPGTVTMQNCTLLAETCVGIEIFADEIEHDTVVSATATACVFGSTEAFLNVAVEVDTSMAELLEHIRWRGRENAWLGEGPVVRRETDDEESEFVVRSETLRDWVEAEAVMEDLAMTNIELRQDIDDLAEAIAEGRRVPSDSIATIAGTAASDRGIRPTAIGPANRHDPRQ